MDMCTTYRSLPGYFFAREQVHACAYMSVCVCVLAERGGWVRRVLCVFVYSGMDAGI